jgi:hypothetical protein
MPFFAQQMRFALQQSTIAERKNTFSKEEFVFAGQQV